MSLARRTGYADLCRLYAGREVLDAQERLTAMLDDQRQEIGGMAELGISPGRWHCGCIPPASCGAFPRTTICRRLGWSR